MSEPMIVVVQRLGLRLWTGAPRAGETVHQALARAERAGAPSGSALAWTGPGWIEALRGEALDVAPGGERRQRALGEALRAQDARRKTRGERAVDAEEAERTCAQATWQITFGRYETWEMALGATPGPGEDAWAAGHRTAADALADDTVWTREHARDVVRRHCPVHIELLRAGGEALRPAIGHPGLCAREAIVQRWRWETSTVTVVERAGCQPEAEADARACAHALDAWRTGDTEGASEVVSFG